MKKILYITKMVFQVTIKVLALGILFIGNFIMNIIGILICAITEG